MKKKYIKNFLHVLKNIFKYFLKTVFTLFEFINNILSLLIIILPIVILYIYKIIFIKNQNYLNKKLCIGIQEVASNIDSIEKCLSTNGVKVTSVVLANTYTILDLNESNKNKKIYKLLNLNFRLRAIILPYILSFYFVKILIQNDIFWFVWNKSFLFLNLDFFILKLFNKKIITMHCGDDVRYRPIQKKIDNNFGIKTWNNANPDFITFLKKFYFQKISERYSQVISTRDQATFQTKPLVHFTFPMKRLIHTKKMLMKS